MGKLIVFEGIDGVGKTTLSKLLVEALTKKGIRAVRYEEVEQLHEGYNILKPYIKEHTPISASFYFYLSSAITKSSIIEKLLQDSWVICDRYIYSTIAYHLSKGLDPKLLPNITTLPIKKPDCFFLVVVDEATRIKRILKRADPLDPDLHAMQGKKVLKNKEEILRSFGPVVVDNSEDNPEGVVQFLVQEVCGSELSVETVAAA